MAETVYVNGENLWSIGNLAKKMGITVRTLQYYDKEGLLKPSAHSEGGRRLYSKKDMVTLYHILALKQLDFSLEEIRERLHNMETPEEIYQVLEGQKGGLRTKINELEETIRAIEMLQEEVQKNEKVDFNQYADIVLMLRFRDEGFWMNQDMFEGNRMKEHIQEKVLQKEAFGWEMYKEYKDIVSEMSRLQGAGIGPESRAGQKVAGKLWKLVMDFADGDLTMLPELVKFSATKDTWRDDMKEKLEEVQEFMGASLGIYFQTNQIPIPDFGEEI